MVEQPEHGRVGRPLGQDVRIGTGPQRDGDPVGAAFGGGGAQRPVGLGPGGPVGQRGPQQDGDPVVSAVLGVGQRTSPGRAATAA